MPPGGGHCHRTPTTGPRGHRLLPLNGKQGAGARAPACPFWRIFFSCSLSDEASKEKSAKFLIIFFKFFLFFFKVYLF